MDKIEKIEGWVARDDDGTLAIHYEKPRRVCYYNNEIVFDGTPWAWENEAGYGLLPVIIFPDLKWEDEPLEVELTIKRVSTLSEQLDKSLEEEYKDYVENDPVYSKLVNRIAGLGIARHFAEWQKSQMLKDGIDCEVKIDAGGYPYIERTIELYDYEKDEPLAKKGDKYKLVLLKVVEDEAGRI